MDSEPTIWDEHPAAELPEGLSADAWTDAEIRRAADLSLGDDAFFSTGVGLLKALRAADRSDLIVKVCREDNELALACIDGFPSQFPLNPEELGALLAHLSPEWAFEDRNLISQHSRAVSRWSPDELKHLPKKITDQFKDPVLSWMIRHGFPPSFDSIAHKLLACGLPLETLYIWGWNRSPSWIFEPSFTTQEKALDQLEQSCPGSALQLYEKFNILNFGRYSLSYLQSLLKAHKDDQPTYGWVFFSGGDNNGALQYDNSFSSSPDLEPGTWLFEVHDVQAVWPKIEAVLERSGRGHFLAFESHANAEGFELLPPRRSLLMDDLRQTRSSLMKDDLYRLNIGPAIQALLYPGSTILLAGCGAGQEGGIAEDIARFGFEVHASEAPCSTARFNVTPQGVLELRHFTGAEHDQPCTRVIPSGN